MRKLKTVACLARWPGLLVLEELLENPRIDLQAVYSHEKLPKAEGGGPRPETYHFFKAVENRCPLFFHDDGTPPRMTGDLLISLSWRYKFPEEYLSTFPHSINIHRGALPKYAGAKPVERALKNQDRRIAITAHKIVEEIDAGDTIAVVYSPIPEQKHSHSTEEHAEVAKEYLYPLYAPLARLAINTIR